MKERKSRYFYLILMLCLSVAACSGSLFRNYGRITPNGEVTQAFESYRVNSDYRYYVSGSHLYPNALIGLNKEYRLDPSSLWREVPEMTPAKMKEIVDHMRAKASQVQILQYGFELTDNEGRPIGVWYSPLWARTLLRMNEDGTVRIDTPDLDTYERLEQNTPLESSGSSK